MATAKQITEATMATAKQIKERLRGHINQRMAEFRTAHQTDFAKDIAYGAVWAASHADAISESERDALIDELHGKVPPGTTPSL